MHKILSYPKITKI